MDAPAPGPFPLAREVIRYLPWFNMLTIVIDVIPLWLVCYAQNLDTVDQYFSVWSFLTGAAMNYMLVCHIIFTLKPVEYMDTLLVAIVGMCLGTVCAFLCLLHKLAVQKSTLLRNLMSLLILTLVVAVGAVVYGIAKQFRADEGWGNAIFSLAVAAAGLLNGIPMYQLAVVDVQPDIRVHIYGVVMSFLRTIDAWFFVAYAHFLGIFGSLFSFISYIAAIISLALFLIYLERTHR